MCDMNFIVYFLPSDSSKITNYSTSHSHSDSSENKMHDMNLWYISCSLILVKLLIIAQVILTLVLEKKALKKK